ncbi:elongation factor 2 [Acrasis kona]|uniref:Elongation factor 2 n=1 Tax=Acrasis kona TaxID=1008807 RepID=A0AAW2ZLM4_9EUKA
MSKQVRNISVIAHVDHGKSTLTDSLVGAAGIISMESVGKRRFTDNRPDEIEKGITIKSTAISLPFTVLEKDYLINVIDSPGHVDFSSEVTAALRVTDGAMVVVDSVEGCRSQTETVLRQALQERIKPVLMVNKLDRCITELQFTPEECYKNLERIIESTNVIISSYADGGVDNVEVDPILGNIAFGSGKTGWAFTLQTFAKFYSEKFKTDTDKLAKKFWGENYYCHERSKWQTSPLSKSGRMLQRGFCEFVLGPIYKLYKILSESEEGKLYENIKSTVEKIGILVTKEDSNKENKVLFQSVMMRFIPASAAMVNMIIEHLPSPQTAQRYRSSLLYNGPLDKYQTSISECNPDGPLMIFVSKMVPMSGSGRFVAFGRIFSGTLRQGHKLRILGPDFNPNTDKDAHNSTAQSVMIMMGKKMESVAECGPGNVVGIIGIDKFVNKSCTVTDESNKDAHPIKNMKHSVSAVVQVAVETEHASDAQKLTDGLKRLSKADSLIQCTFNDSGQHVIAGAGELHLEICIGELQGYLKGIVIKKSKPIVSLTETVSSVGEKCLAKSPNKLNRIYVSAEPLSDDLVRDMESSDINFQDAKACAKALTERHGWDSEEAKRVWAMGPDEQKPTNVLVDCTRGIAYLNDVKDYIVDAFRLVTASGVLSEEQTRGIKFNVVDVHLHNDSSHRGALQITSMARRALLGAMLAARPRIMEPIYSVDVQTHESVMGGIYNVINKRRGVISGTEQTCGTPICVIKCTVPVLDSFGLTEELRSVTSGQAFPQLGFDHWSVINCNPLEDQTKSNNLVKETRTRKKLNVNIPVLSDFVDRM